jgi:hypothetical protein
MSVYPINVARSILVTTCHNESIVLIQIGSFPPQSKRDAGVCLSFPYYCTCIIAFMNIHKASSWEPHAKTTHTSAQQIINLLIHQVRNDADAISHELKMQISN